MRYLGLKMCATLLVVDKPTLVYYNSSRKALVGKNQHQYVYDIHRAYKVLLQEHLATITWF